MPDGLGVQLDGESWPISDVFKWLWKAGDVTPEEMARTFNCGIGMIAIVAPEFFDPAVKTFSEAGETVYKIGSVSNADQQTPVEIINWEKAWQG